MSKVRTSVLAFVFVVFATFFVTPTAFADDATDAADLGDLVSEIVDEVIEMITGGESDAEDESHPIIDPVG